MEQPASVRQLVDHLIFLRKERRRKRLIHPASALNQEAGDFGGHVVEHVEQLVIGVENLQGCVGVTELAARF